MKIVTHLFGNRIPTSSDLGSKTLESNKNLEVILRNAAQCKRLGMEKEEKAWAKQAQELMKESPHST